MKLTEIKVIAFDADDTLWHNENYFQEVETAFCQLLEDTFRSMLRSANC